MLVRVCSRGERTSLIDGIYFCQDVVLLLHFFFSFFSNIKTKKKKLLGSGRAPEQNFCLPRVPERLVRLQKRESTHPMCAELFRVI